MDTTHKGVNISGGNMLVLADMDKGTLNMTSAQLNVVSKETGEHCSPLAQGEGCARETGTLMVGANSTNVTGVEDTHTVAHNDKTETTTVGVAVRNAY